MTKAAQIIRDERFRRKRVVFASGCFDILHAGHIVFLEECKQGADFLVVGIDDNETARRAKGEEHPFFDETERMKVMAALKIVDRVFKFQGPCNVELLSMLNPNMYAFSPYDPKHSQKTEDARLAGIEVKEAGYELKAWSSSKIGRAIRFSFLLDSWLRPG